MKTILKVAFMNICLLYVVMVAFLMLVSLEREDFNFVAISKLAMVVLMSTSLLSIPTIVILTASSIKFYKMFNEKDVI